MCRFDRVKKRYFNNARHNTNNCWGGGVEPPEIPTQIPICFTWFTRLRGDNTSHFPGTTEKNYNFHFQCFRIGLSDTCQII